VVRATSWPWIGTFSHHWDLDSLTEEEQHSLENASCKVIKYPHDKNETDLELALRFAVEAGYREILIVGALGGRSTRLSLTCLC